MNQTSPLGCYLFCVIPEEDTFEFGEVTMGGQTAKVRTVPYAGLSMVIADLPVTIYVPNKEDLLAHQEVITGVMKKYTVIPMSFGTILSSEQEVQTLINKIEPQLKATFPKVENKIEVGLKVVAKKDWLFEQVHNDPNLKNRKQTTSKSYYNQIEVGEIAKKFITSLRKNYEMTVIEPLGTISDSVKVNEPIDERMLLNASFLVDKSKEEAFDKKVNDLYEDISNQVDFYYTGPWPAYNFIELVFKAEKAR